MSDAATQNGKQGNAVDATPTAQSSISPRTAGLIGVGLILACVISFGLPWLGLTSGPASLGFMALAGIITLSVSLYGLVALMRAIGMSDGREALSLPHGSVQALLALVLAIIFVAVASWALGGMNDPVGPLVYSAPEQAGQTDEMLSKYNADTDKDKYVIFTDRTTGGYNVRVYLKRVPDSAVTDMAKQIITISATVLVTIVGFYFGSKTAADAIGTAGDTLSNAQKAITSVSSILSRGSDTSTDNTSDDSDQNAGGNPPDPDAAKANALSNLHMATAGSPQAASAFATAVAGYANAVKDTPVQPPVAAPQVATAPTHAYANAALLAARGST